MAQLSSQQSGYDFMLYYWPHQKKEMLSTGVAEDFKLIPLPVTFKERFCSAISMHYDAVSLYAIGRLLIGVWGRIHGKFSLDVDSIHDNPRIREFLRKHAVEWIFYTAPDTLAFEAKTPFVMPIHDLQHRIQPHFPEVSAGGQWNLREYLFRNAARFATLILADSETGKEDILQYYGEYGITPDRIKVVPFVAPPYLFSGVQGGSADVRKKYALPENYFFYPAQFWPHKNHIRLVEAVSMLKQQGVAAHIIFCGHHTGELRDRTFREVMGLAAERGISSQVHYLGRVPDSDIPAIYAGATALVMPTYFGPTNIPVVEAWAFGCPVLTSDLRGIREQVGDAGLLADPDSAEDIAGKMRTLMLDENLRRNLSEKGRLRIRQYSFDGFHAKLSEVVREATERVSQGDIPVQP